MWEKLRVIFTIPELRKKVFLTLALLAIYRIGYFIHLPVVDPERVTSSMASEAGGGWGDYIERVAVFTASDLRQATIFGLGIMPYISASIIFQLLGTVWTPLEELKKEGEAGRKKINEYTRYLTVVLCLFQSYVYVKFYVMQTTPGQPSLVHEAFLNASGQLHFGWMLTSVMIMTSGTVFLMWLGEQIDEYGIGNGISLLIMAGILARMPEALVRPAAQTCEWSLHGFGTGKHRCGDVNHPDLPLCRGGVGRGVHHAGATTNSDAERQARSRPASLRRHSTIPAAEDQPGRRDADHLRQQPADVAGHGVQLVVRRFSRATRSPGSLRMFGRQRRWFTT